MKSAGELTNEGNRLYSQGDMIGARLHYEAALEADPFYILALANLATVLDNEYNFEAAASVQKLIVTIAPQDGSQWNKLGTVLMHLGRYDEAEAAMNNAKVLIPDHPEVWHNLSLLMGRMDRYDESLAYIDRAKYLGHETVGIKNDEGLTLMHKGDLREALPAYENRWELLTHSPAWDFHIPEWNGEPLAGKSILMHVEQGYGDTLMMSRFARNLKALGADVTLGVTDKMIRLFEAQDWSVKVLDVYGMTSSDAKQFDFQSPEFSVLRHLGVEQKDIDGRAYLKAPDILSPPLLSRAFNVGICWASGKRGTDADWRRRVAPLVDFLQLFEVPGTQLYSLQGGPDGNAIRDLGVAALVHNPLKDVTDWADTAAFVSKLDLVVTVDTAVAHLSAAMGVRTWMLEQNFHCWRWWDLKNGTGRPWYNDMRILYQTDPSTWRPLLTQCRDWLLEETRQKPIRLAA